MCILPNSSDADYLLDPSHWVELNQLPIDIQSVTQLSTQLLITLRSSWVTTGAEFAAGSLIAVDIYEFIEKGVNS